MERKCAGSNCGEWFEPDRRVKNQQYCSRPACQRERKKLWHRRKLCRDVGYRLNRSAAQREWRTRHPDYYRDYRASHPDYCERNRVLQQARNRSLRYPSVVAAGVPTDGVANMDSSVIAKTDAITQVVSGTYRLIPVVSGLIAKTDELVVQLSFLSTGYGLASDCKDRTR